MSDRPRVLLVEDDPALQRFVALALDTLDLDLLRCTCVEEALRVLSDQAVELIVTDLMLPDRSGLELIEALGARSEAAPRMMVFSAGITPKVRARLATAGVSHCLDKPCTVAQLQAAVRQGLCWPEASTPTAHGGEPAPAAAEPDAVMTSFGGNRSLHDAFRASCLLQFPADLNAGSRACRTGDMPSLRSLAHNLKSVLRTLGHRDAALVAERLERAAEAGNPSLALPLWDMLHSRIRALLA